MGKAIRIDVALVNGAKWKPYVEEVTNQFREWMLRGVDEMKLGENVRYGSNGAPIGSMWVHDPENVQG